MSGLLQPLVREEMLAVSGGMEEVPSFEYAPGLLLVHWAWRLIQSIPAPPSSNYMYGKVGYSG